MTGIGMGNCRRPDVDGPQLNESLAAAWVLHPRARDRAARLRKQSGNTCRGVVMNSG